MITVDNARCKPLKQNGHVMLAPVGMRSTMPIVPGRSSKLPIWIIIAMMLVTVFAAAHGIKGLITGSVLVPRSHGHYAALSSDPKTYEWSEAFWLVGAGIFGFAGFTLASKRLLKNPSVRSISESEK